jgi:threonine aldolase
VPLEGTGGKLTAEELHTAISSYSPQARFFRPSAVSLTQAGELGTVYRLDELAALADTTHRAGLKLHVDGARWANAVAAMNCSPAEASWRAGVDVLSFGATKNGALAAEAVVFFDRDLMAGAAELRKRAGMVWSKHRFLAVQWQAYLRDHLWLKLATAANERAAALARGLLESGVVRLTEPVEANKAFAWLPESIIDQLEAEGFSFYRRGGGVIRLVTCFSTTKVGRRQVCRVGTFPRPSGRRRLKDGIRR